MITQKNRLAAIMLSVAFLLLIPFLAMQFTNEVKWKPFDFIIAGVLLLGTGLLCELVLQKVKERDHRILFCLAVLAAMFLVWAEIAVGIFGTPFAGS